MVSDNATAAASSGAKPIKILTVGMGALGTIYSFALSQCREPPVHMTCVARSNYSTLRDPKVGITIQSEKYGVHPNWTPDQVYQEGNESHHLESQQQEYDYVLCCFKIVDEITPTSEVLKPWLKKGGKPTLVLIQNGIAIENEPQRNLVPEYAKGIATGVAWIGANLKENGTIVTHGSLDRIEVGEFSPCLEELTRFAKMYEFNGGQMDVKSDIQASRWIKLLWNTSWSTICALSRQPLPDLLDPAVLPYIAGPVYQTMLEVVKVARAQGINEQQLSQEDITKVFRITYDLRPPQVPDENGHLPEGQSALLSPGFKPSLLMDLESGRPMELKGVIGNVVQLARQKGVDTPRLDLILAALRASQVLALRSRDALADAERVAWGHKDRLPAGQPENLEP
ncbi:unnamed protein product [Sympodiomycopsis kandeliae]